MTDTELLDFLTARGKECDLKWLARLSTTGRGWRLHQDPSGEFETPREAIEDAVTRLIQPKNQSG